MNMDFLTDSILAEFGRSDFIGGIDNEALDFGHLEQFIHSNAATTANTSPSVVNVDDDNNTQTHNLSTTIRNDQHQQQHQISTVESNDNHHQQQTNINNITTVNNRINSSSSSGIINISTSTIAQPQQTITNSSVNTVAVAVAAVTQTHLPESPPDSGSEPAYSPAGLHGLTLTSHPQQQQPQLPDSPPDSGSEPSYSPRGLHGLTLTTQPQQHINAQQPPPSTPVLQNNNDLTAISDGSISMSNINEITQRHNQHQQLHILSEHQQQQQLNHQLHNNSHFISEQHQPQLHSILCNNHIVNSNGLFIRSSVCGVGSGGVSVDVIDNGTVHNLQQQHISHHNSQTITIRKPDDILLATTTTVIGNGITSRELQMQHNHQQQHLSTASTRTLELESNYHNSNQNGLLSTATDNNLMGLVEISPISGNTSGPISTIPNNSIVVGNSDSVNDITENEDLSHLIPGIYTSNDLRNHQSQQTLQDVGLLSPISTEQHQQSNTSTNDLDNNLSENRSSTINVRKRKLSHTDNSMNNKISQITDSMEHIISVVKPEPDTSLSPICHHQNIKPPLSPLSPNLSTTIPSNLSMPSDQSSLDGSIQQNSDSTLEQSPLQCIRFSPFQQQSWHILCNQNLQELPIPHYRVDADKGFNFSNSDDAFVCQKKNHFQITCHVQLQGTAIFVRTPTGLEKIKSFNLHFYGVKLESPNQMIRVEQSQSDRSKKPFHPVPIDLKNRLLSKVTVGRLHFSETTSNNMRKKGRPNPEQRYFQLVVGLHAHTHTGNFPVISQGSERIIVRASNPGQFESDIELCWQRGITQDSIFHAGRVGINTDRPDESLVIHGNIKLSGHIVQPSDSRAKREIMELDTAIQLKNMQKIRVVRYCYEPEFAIHSGLKKPKLIYGNNNNLDYNLNNNKNNDDDDDDEQIIDTGVIAQEVREILPDAVTEAGSIVLPSGQVIENFLLVNKDRILMENIGAVKELCKVTGSLETRIEQLEKINSRLLHIQQLDRNHNCIKNKNKLKLDDDEYTSGKCNGEICSNTTIQMIIITLVIIMAICLAAISTLYFIERSKKSYSSKPYIYSSRQNHIDNNFNHKYQYATSTLQPLIQPQSSSSHQYIPTSISYLSTPAGNGVNENDEIIQNINNKNNSISSSINSSDIIDISNYKIKNTNITKWAAPLPPPPLPPLQSQQQSISKHIQLDNKKIINKSNSTKINIIIKTNNINDNYNNNNHNNNNHNNHHNNNITSSEKISVVTVDILEPQDVENNSIDTDVQQQQKQHEKELHHNEQLANNQQQQQQQTPIILKVLNSDTNNNDNIDDIITKNVKPSLAKAINNNNIQSITTTTTTMSSSSTYHNTIDNITVTSEQLNNINDLILITNNNNYKNKNNNTNININQNNNINIKNDSDQQDLQDLNNNSESEDQIDISSQLTQTKNKFILTPIIGTPNNCLKNDYKLETLKINKDPSDASNINSKLNCIDSGSIIIINECQSICCKENINNLSLDNHKQQNNYDNIDIINNNDTSKSVTVTSIEHIIDPKHEINNVSNSSIILLKNEQKYNNSSNNNNNKNYNKKNNNHHNKNNNNYNNSKILNNDKEYDFIDDHLKIFTKIQQDPVKKSNRSKTDLLITSNLSNKHNNTNNIIINNNNNNKNNNNPDYNKKLTYNNDKQLSDDCSSIVPWILTDSVNKSLEAVTVCFNSGYNLNITYSIPISKYMQETKLEIHFIGSSKLHWIICNDQELTTNSIKIIDKNSGGTSYSSTDNGRVISGGDSVIITDDDDNIDDKDNNKPVIYGTQKSILIDESINSSINNFNKYENDNNNDDNDDNSTINRIYQSNPNKAIFYLNLPNYGYFNRRIKIIATSATDNFRERKNTCMTNNYDQTDDLTKIIRYNLNIYRNCD